MHVPKKLVKEELKNLEQKDSGRKTAEPGTSSNRLGSAKRANKLFTELETIIEKPRKSISKKSYKSEERSVDSETRCMNQMSASFRFNPKEFMTRHVTEEELLRKRLSTSIEHITFKNVSVSIYLC